jgi:endonuclease-3 related protein
MNKDFTKQKLHQIYDKMFQHFGHRGWWPGDSDFEICVGAVLTQSVSWKNVAKAIENLKKAGLLDLNKMYDAAPEDIEKCIIPTLYYRQKAKKLKAFVSHVTEKYSGDLTAFLGKNLPELRAELLSLYGIGPETADSIILYAAEQPVFVVDTYTRRIFSRLSLFDDDITYEEMQNYFMSHLPNDVQFYNEYHALIVGIGNRFCSNKKPKCAECPLTGLCRRE